jgi:hypothetical protein
LYSDNNIIFIENGGNIPECYPQHFPLVSQIFCKARGSAREWSTMSGMLRPYLQILDKQSNLFCLTARNEVLQHCHQVILPSGASYHILTSETGQLKSMMTASGHIHKWSVVSGKHFLTFLNRFKLNTLFYKTL